MEQGEKKRLLIPTFQLTRKQISTLDLLQGSFGTAVPGVMLKFARLSRPVIPRLRQPKYHPSPLASSSHSKTRSCPRTLHAWSGPELWSFVEIFRFEYSVELIDVLCCSASICDEIRKKLCRDTAFVYSGHECGTTFLVLKRMGISRKFVFAAQPKDNFRLAILVHHDAQPMLVGIFYRTLRTFKDSRVRNTFLLHVAKTNWSHV